MCPVAKGAKHEPAPIPEEGKWVHSKKIEDILYSRDDEIRFIMSGNIDEYEVYTYNIPVPQKMNAHPFFCKGNTCLFPAK